MNNEANLINELESQLKDVPKGITKWGTITLIGIFVILFGCAEYIPFHYIIVVDVSLETNIDFETDQEHPFIGKIALPLEQINNIASDKQLILKVDTNSFNVPIDNLFSLDCKIQNEIMIEIPRELMNSPIDQLVDKSVLAYIPIKNNFRFLLIEPFRKLFYESKCHK